MAAWRTYRSERLCAFSDGVFAIAITLLVLDLKVPDTPNVPIVEAVSATLPKFDSWLISFFVIGALWLRHHVMLSELKRVDLPIIWLNLVMLLFISFMPWVTALTGIYQNEPLSIVLLSGTIGLAWTALACIWLYASRHDHLLQEFVRRRSRLETLFLVARGIVAALISISLAYVNVSLGLYSLFLIFVFDILIHIYFSRGEDARAEPKKS